MQGIPIERVQHAVMAGRVTGGGGGKKSLHRGNSSVYNAVMKSLKTGSCAKCKFYRHIGAQHRCTHGHGCNTDPTATCARWVRRNG